MLEKTYPVTGVLKFMDVGPYFGLPCFIMNCGCAAGGAASVELSNQARRDGNRAGRQFDENAAHFLNVFFVANDVFVAQQVAEGQLSGFMLGFVASVKRTILRPHLFG